MRKMLILILAATCGLMSNKSEAKKVSDHVTFVGRQWSAASDMLQSAISQVQKDLQVTMQNHPFEKAYTDYCAAKAASDFGSKKESLSARGQSVQKSLAHSAEVAQSDRITAEKVVNNLGAQKESWWKRLWFGQSAGASAAKQEKIAAAKEKLNCASKGTTSKGAMIATADGRAFWTEDKGISGNMFERLCKAEDSNAQLQSQVSQLQSQVSELQEKAAKPGVVRKTAQYVADTVKHKAQTQGFGKATWGAVILSGLGLGTAWYNYAEQQAPVLAPNHTELAEAGSLLTHNRAKVFLGLIMTGIGVRGVYKNQKSIQKFMHQRMSMRPSVIEIVKSAQGNKQKLISDLRRYHYKQNEIEAGQLVGYGINAKLAKNIITSLEV